MEAGAQKDKLPTTENRSADEVRSRKNVLDAYVCASECNNENCTEQNCCVMKPLIIHLREGLCKGNQNCEKCFSAILFSGMHGEMCQLATCLVPLCPQNPNSSHFLKRIQSTPTADLAEQKISSADTQEKAKIGKNICANCNGNQCGNGGCRSMNPLVAHFNEKKCQKDTNCDKCWAVLSFSAKHAKFCQETNCGVPLCPNASTDSAMNSSPSIPGPSKQVFFRNFP